jgi:hypothetical protein
MTTDERPSLDALAHGGDRVHLVIPPSSDFLRTARLVAADSALRAGCDVDEVEDFRIAVDELCHVLMTATDHHVHVSLVTFDSYVTAHGSARARHGATCELDEVSALIVRATTDEHRVGLQRGEVTFDLLKRTRRGARPGDRRLASQQ